MLAQTHIALCLHRDGTDCDTYAGTEMLATHMLGLRQMLAKIATHTYDTYAGTDMQATHIATHMLAQIAIHT